MTMVDEFASVWPIVALEGVGDLIGDGRAGLVAVAAGRRLAFANPAAVALFDAPTAWGDPLAVDRRLADRISRFAERAAPGEEARELLRFAEAGRPSLRTVVFRRPIDSDDAVIVIVDGPRTDPAAASIDAALAPFAVDGGLVALFDADGAVLGAVGDLDPADDVVGAVETVLAEADEIAVLERTLTTADARHDLVLVRLGDRPDARRLLRLGPGRPLVATVPAEAPSPSPVPEAATATTVAATSPVAAVAEPLDDDLDADRFLAVPPLPTDLFGDHDDTDEGPAPTASDVVPEATVEDAATSELEPTEPVTETEPAVSAPATAAVPETIVDVPGGVAGRLPLVAAAEVPPLTATEIDRPADEDSLPEPAPIAPRPVAVPAPVVAPPEVTASEAPAFVFTPLERPLKFVWQMDADRRFTFVSDEFAGVVGPIAGDLLGRSWDEIATRLDVDPDRAVADVLSRHDTWSGRTVLWPIDGTTLRLPVDLAALPAFDRGRTFTGFRGFGTCRAEAPRPDPLATGLRLAAAPTATTAASTSPEETIPEAAELSPEPLEEPTIAEPIDEASATDAPAVACVVEELVEPPLFPDDRESALPETDHPIEPSFAGDIGDDPLFERAMVEEVEDVVADVEASPAATVTPTIPEDTLPPIGAEPTEAPSAVAGQEIPAPVAEPAAPTRRPAPRLVALADTRGSDAETTRLSVPERNAFRQIAEALGARIEGDAAAPPAATPRVETMTAPAPVRTGAHTAASASLPLDSRLLDRLPLALALLRDDALVHANEAFLSLLRYRDLDDLRAAGGIDALFAGPHATRRFATGDSRPIPLLARDGTVLPCDATIASVPVEGGTAAVLLLLSEHDTARPAAAQGSAADRERIGELQAIVDTATDGVLILDGSGLVLSANAAAEALFGTERRTMIGRSLTERLAPESRRSAMDYLDGLAANGVASVLNDGREVIGVVAPEGLIPLFMTIGRVSTGPVAKYCAVLRDITQWKKSEEELTTARRRAEEASIHKSDFLAKISHEIRTPLNAIIGFSELMLDERFGPIGNDRYKDYLRDIHVSGSHIMSLVNDLLDLSKVEAGKMDLRFEAVPLAEVVSECVALMQPQANRERIIIRSSLPTDVPPVVADPRSMRQVVLNLLSNAVKFTPAGGQVIVSITLEDNGEVVLRVRDTGYGMSEKELQTAMEPFRQLHTTGSRGGTGLGLPLTKALTEANRAAFRIDSTVGQGTLVSIAFPVTRVLAG